MHKLWFYDEHKEICVCAPAKCGTTSLRFALDPTLQERVDEWRKNRGNGGAPIVTLSNEGFRHGPYTPEEVNKVTAKGKYLAIRHPVDRFRSLWQDKCCRDPEGSPLRQRLNGMSPAQLLQMIKYFPMGDRHWYPQYLYRVPGTTLIPHQKFLTWLGYKNKVYNKSEAVDAVMPSSDIIEYYSQDYELWESLSDRKAD